MFGLLEDAHNMCENDWSNTFVDGGLAANDLFRNRREGQTWRYAILYLGLYWKPRIWRRLFLEELRELIIKYTQTSVIILTEYLGMTSVCANLIHSTDNKNAFKKLITGDETCNRFLKVASMIILLIRSLNLNFLLNKIPYTQKD